MKIKKTRLVQNRNDWLDYIFIQLLTLAHDKHGVTSFTEVEGWQDLAEKEAVDIVVTIEGVEVPFIEVVENMEKEFKRQVGLAAKQLVEDKMSESFEALDQLTETVRDTLETKFNKQLDADQWAPPVAAAIRETEENNE